MEFTPEDLTEFKEVYHRNFGIKLTDEQALEYATVLVNLMAVIYRPIPKPSCEHQKDVVE